MLCDFGGLTQRQAADVLGLRSGAAVSAQLQKLSEQLDTGLRLRKQVAAIAAQLQATCR
jgi:DNA-directed RNA polymerase specialized sigma24 family protein